MQLKIPLMGVMLLWSLTRPGQEMEVYRFLLSGATGEPVQAVALADNFDDGSTTVKPEATHAYEEARLGGAVPMPFLPGVLASVVSAYFYSDSQGAVTTFRKNAPDRLPGRLLLFSVHPNAP
ncbi:hypothetical protein [Rufibacter sp. LB8]|uniref:hypothetical protein n=1 Tax=Rufibacter sp. LB8 TaxID=2777781 RepID=UPI00178C75EE|nr:hypothetical protein [Rufibacter sp. LB8]